MKTFTLKSFVFLSALLTFSESYHAYSQPGVYQTGQQWNVYTTPTSTTIQPSTIIFYFNQYAQYNGYVYKMLYCDSGDIVGISYGMYREEDGKVFMRKINNWKQVSEEYLIYDWKLNIGDTAYVQLENNETGLVLDAVTDTIINDDERRVFHLHYETNADLTEVWIEGMGSELGFPFSGTRNNPVNPFYYPMTTEMLCYYEDGVLCWDNPNYDECVINYWDVPEDHVADVWVYPNPTRDVVSIKHGDQICETIEIFDSFGRMLYHDIMNEAEKTIDISMFPKGVYYVLLYGSNNTKCETLLVL